MIRVVKVLIDGATNDLTFTYSVPDGVSVQPGQRVRVPLRNRKSIGTVTDVESIDPASLKYSLKPIDGTVSDDPFLTPGLIELTHWIAGFYLASVAEVFRTMLPKPSRGEAEKRKTEKHVMLAVPKADIDFEQFSSRLAKQGDVLRELREVESISLARMTGELGASRSSIKSLEEKGLVRLTEKIVTRD